jgi:hypothetical protein
VPVIHLNEEQLVRVRQALWTAHFYSAIHRHAYGEFNEAVAPCDKSCSVCFPHLHCSAEPPMQAV